MDAPTIVCCPSFKGLAQTEAGQFRPRNPLSNGSRLIASRPFGMGCRSNDT
jgi:hypothetical protein